MPLTRIPNGSSSCAKEDVAWPIALFEYMYGQERPLVAQSYNISSEPRSHGIEAVANECTLVQPFMLLVIMTWGTNLAAAWLDSVEFFHASSRGKNANVNQYGPMALVLRTLLKSSWDTGSKYFFTNDAAVGSSGAPNVDEVPAIPALLKRVVIYFSRLPISWASRMASD